MIDILSLYMKAILGKDKVCIIEVCCGKLFCKINNQLCFVLNVNYIKLSLLLKLYAMLLHKKMIKKQKNW